MFQRNVKAQSYINEVFRPVNLQFVCHQYPRGRCLLQQDNDPTDRARRTKNFMQQNNIVCLVCPSISPDMDPKEHVCNELGRRVRACTPSPATVPQFCRNLLKE